MKKLFAMFAFSLLAATGIHAQQWPTKTVTLLVPFPPAAPRI